MGLTYFDAATGRTRIKRRYVWGLGGYAAGFVTMGIVYLMLVG